MYTIWIIVFVNKMFTAFVSMILLDLYQSEIDDFALSLVEWDRELVEEWVWVLV